jgi:hypothetical protein
MQNLMLKPGINLAGSSARAWICRTRRSVQAMIKTHGAGLGSHFWSVNLLEESSLSIHAGWQERYAGTGSGLSLLWQREQCGSSSSQTTSRAWWQKWH